jgi:HEAT repeat protein
MDKISEYKHYFQEVDIHDLIDELHSPFTDIRHKAHWNLVRIGSDAIQSLVALLHGSDRRLACEAAQILGEMDSPAGPRSLVKLLLDEDPLARWDATKALIAMDRGGVIALLEALVTGYSSPRLRDGARDIFYMLNQAHRLTQDEEKVFDALEGPYADSEVSKAARAALKAREEIGCPEPV